MASGLEHGGSGFYRAPPAEKPRCASVSPFCDNVGGSCDPLGGALLAGLAGSCALAWLSPAFPGPPPVQGWGGLPGPIFCPAEGLRPGGAGRQPPLGHSLGQGARAPRPRAEPVPWTPLGLQQPSKAAEVPRGAPRGPAAGGLGAPPRGGGVREGAVPSRRAGKEPAPGRG